MGFLKRALTTQADLELILYRLLNLFDLIYDLTHSSRPKPFFHTGVKTSKCSVATYIYKYTATQYSFKRIHTYNTDTYTQYNAWIQYKTIYYNYNKDKI